GHCPRADGCGPLTERPEEPLQILQHPIAEVSAAAADEKPHYRQSHYCEDDKKFHVVSAAAEGDDDLPESNAEQERRGNSEPAVPLCPHCRIGHELQAF